MRFTHILLLFLVWRIVTFIAIFLAPSFIPLNITFPYIEILQAFNVPKYLYSLANFDGVHYIIIAQGGYNTYQQAFFPLYPICIAVLSPLFFGNQLFAALFISHVSFFLSLVLWNKLLQIMKIQPQKIVWSMLVLILFPTSFFFGLAYTESLFLLLSLLCIIFVLQQRYIYIIGIGFLASLTRISGVFLAILPIMTVVSDYLFTKKNSDSFIAKLRHLTQNTINKLRTNPTIVAAIIGPLLGLIAYSAYLYVTTGDPLFYLSSQEAFGANRTSSLVSPPQVIFRYIKIFITADISFKYWMAVFEFISFIAIASILLLDMWRLFRKDDIKEKGLRLGINTFSWAVLLLPTLTGTLSSIPRYGLLCLTIYFCFAEIRSKYVKFGLLCVFGLLQLVLLSFFVQGYFVS